MKSTLHLIIFFFLCMAQFLSPRDCTEGDCKNGKGILKMEDQGRYEGDFKEEKFNGFGYLISPKGHKYLGQFKNGLIHGIGTLYFPGKKFKIYHGSFKYGKREGYGKMNYNSFGKEYTGYWKNGKKHGKGIMIYDMTTKYEGMWVNGKKHGFGVYESGKKKFRYTGEWKNNLFDGKGVLETLEKTKIFKYEGFFIKGKFKGQGKLLKDEFVYKGQFNNNIIEGVGTLISKMNQRYTGGFKNSLFNGRGILISQDGSYFVGEFTNGERNGVGEVFDKENKLLYSGRWIKGKFKSEENKKDDFL